MPMKEMHGKIWRSVVTANVEDLKNPKLWVGSAAEFLGTLILVIIGCGSCVTGTDWQQYRASVLEIAFTFGLAVATSVWCLSHVAGAGHINPAITVAVFCVGKITFVRAAAYVIAQVVGAIVGAALLYALTPSLNRGGLGTTHVSRDVLVGQAFVVELIITFILVLTVFATCDPNRENLHGSAALAIGISVFICHSWAIKYTGSGMNPARSFGPAVIMNSWKDHWIYWIGPLVGGVAAGFIYELLFAVDASPEKVRRWVGCWHSWSPRIGVSGETSEGDASRAERGLKHWNRSTASSRSAKRRGRHDEPTSGEEDTDLASQTLTIGSSQHTKSSASKNSNHKSPVAVETDVSSLAESPTSSWENVNKTPDRDGQKKDRHKYGNTLLVESAAGQTSAGNSPVGEINRSVQTSPAAPELTSEKAATDSVIHRSSKVPSAVPEECTPVNTLTPVSTAENRAKTSAESDRSIRSSPLTQILTGKSANDVQNDPKSPTSGNKQPAATAENGQRQRVVVPPVNPMSSPEVAESHQSVKSQVGSERPSSMRVEDFSDGLDESPRTQPSASSTPRVTATSNKSPSPASKPNSTPRIE